MFLGAHTALKGGILSVEFESIFSKLNESGRVINGFVIDSKWDSIVSREWRWEWDVVGYTTGYSERALLAKTDKGVIAFVEQSANNVTRHAVFVSSEEVVYPFDSVFEVFTSITSKIELDSASE